MDSSATLSHHPKLVPRQCDTFFRAGKYPSSRRTASFSSSSSSLSPSSSSLESFYFPSDDPLLSPPSSPSPVKFSGVPFSWEQLPGIPKKQSSKKNLESSIKLLPLPPPTSHGSETRIRKKNSLQRDPFIAAMVECSKDDDDDEDEEEEEERSRRSFWNSGAKVSRSLSDRFGFINLYSSCKTSCSVSDSLIYLPSSRRSSSYEHFVSRRSLHKHRY